MKTRILIFSAFYLPGYRGGGPIRSLANIVEKLSDEYQFFVVTLDRDLGQLKPYADVPANEWIDVRGAEVFYCNPEKVSFWWVVRFLRRTSCDVLYLNSFFDLRFSIYPILSVWLRLVPQRRVILAPRGEFSEGALNIKRRKKSLFLSFSRFFGWHEKIIWQASTALEQADIKRQVGEAARFFVSENLTSKSSVNPLTKEERGARGVVDERLRICFLSRISPKKNLHFALNVLKDVTVPVLFTIYGPKEDYAYWQSCERLIEYLPKNIKVSYAGEISNDQVGRKLLDQDLLFFPTQGENFGHVIAEALAVGLPVLISDRTPWLGLGQLGVGWDIPLSEPLEFIEAIESFSKLSGDERFEMRRTCLKFSMKKSLNGDSEITHRKMFRYAAGLPVTNRFS